MKLDEMTEKLKRKATFRTDACAFKDCRAEAPAPMFGPFAHPKKGGFVLCQSHASLLDAGEESRAGDAPKPAPAAAPAPAAPKVNTLGQTVDPSGRWAWDGNAWIPNVDHIPAPPPPTVEAPAAGVEPVPALGPAAPSADTAPTPKPLAKHESPEVDRGAIAAMSADVSATLVGLASFEVRTQGDLDMLGSLLGEVKKQAKRLDEMRKRATRPMNEALNEVRSWFKPAETALEELERAIKGRITAWHEAQAAQLDAARASINAAATAEEVEGALSTLATAHASPDGVVLANVWDFEVVDLRALAAAVASGDKPDVYLSVNERVIRAEIAGGVREIPGVRVFQRTQVRATAG